MRRRLLSLLPVIFTLLVLLETFVGAQPAVELVNDWPLTPVSPERLEFAEHPQDGWLYGVSSSGGASGNGMIFRMNFEGEIDPLVHLTGTSGVNVGSRPNGKLILGADDRFYGVTRAGGALQHGSIFAVSREGEFTNLVEFTNNGPVNKGRHPDGGLTLGADGNFYGMTSEGGAGGHGTVFRMTSAGILTTLIEFTDNGASNKGRRPTGSLTLAANGHFYGLTENGGGSGYGTVFSMTQEGVLTTWVEFTGNGVANKGRGPVGGLTAGVDGNLFGMTNSGGSLGNGTVFSVTPAGVLTTLVNFTDKGATEKGAFPTGKLALGSDGSFYGMTNGGPLGFGTVFSMTPAGVLTTPVEFTSNGVSNKGAYAGSNLIQASDGNFYGGTVLGGAFNGGSVFVMTPAGQLTTLQIFSLVGGSEQGSRPHGSLTAGIDGRFYGTTVSGGGAKVGTLFSLTPKGERAKVLEFSGNGAVNRGSTPQDSLVPGPDGSFYGVTSTGGATSHGTIFSLSPAGQLATLVEFTGNGGENKGSSPHGSPIRGADRNLYGMTRTGGSGGHGTIYSMTPAGDLTTLVEFTNNGASNKGRLPHGSLIQHADGNFYGMTTQGGTGDHGTVFVMNSAGLLTTLVNFSNNGVSNKGRYPYGSLTLGADGQFYGLTSEGGAHGKGTLFSMTSGGQLTTVLEFTGNGLTNKGGSPRGSLTLASDGKFYGMTHAGGAYDFGTVFSLTAEGVLTTLLEFALGGQGVESGGRPEYSRLVPAADGNLYGVTAVGGQGGGGIVFRLVLFRRTISLSGNSQVIGADDQTPAADNHTDFGTANLSGGTVTRTFAIGNPGDSDLHLTGSPKIAISGVNASDFTVSAQPESPVAAAANTTFAITFDPSAAGVRSAVVSIASDDLTHTPFTFAIQGTGTAAGAITFNEASFSVNQGATFVNVTVQRSGTAACAVSLQPEDGTSLKVPPFAPALAGVDYIGSPAGTTIAFAEDEVSKVIAIPLIPKTAANTPNKRFTIRLVNPTEGATLGATSTAAVKILANDLVKPKLAVTAPAMGAKVSMISPYVIKGTVGDAKGIARVTFSLNGSDPVTAELAPATAPTAVPWSASIMPNPGENTLVITAFDLKDNSVSISRKFTFTRRYLLSLARSTPVTKPDLAGLVAFAAAPATAASALAPATANSNPRTSQILPGTKVKLTATARPNHVFSHWTGLPGSSVTLGNVASFTMPSADVGPITAVFIATPFALPAGSPNTFHGLLRPTGATPSTHATEGLITGTLIASGTFTGKLSIDGVIQPIAAAFFGDGSALFTVGSVKSTSLAFGGRTLSLSFDFLSNHIAAEFTKGTDTSAGVATRPIYSSAAKVPVSLLDSPNAAKGYYTVAFEPMAPTVDMPAARFPQGYGFAWISLGKTGTATLTGTLADGSSITASSPILAGDRFPILIQQPTPGAPAKKGGSFSGLLAFDVTQPNSDVLGDLRWFRPAAVGTSVKLYTAGWSSGVLVNGLGAFYKPAIKLDASLGLSAPDASGNAQLTFADGNLTAAIVKTNLKISGNTITKIPTTDPMFTLGFTSSTGAIGGSFSPNWPNPVAAKPAFKGIVIQKLASRGGFGFFLSNAKADRAPQSGSVHLKAP